MHLMNNVSKFSPSIKRCFITGMPVARTQTIEEPGQNGGPPETKVIPSYAWDGKKLCVK